jgi:hypothetical protein
MKWRAPMANTLADQAVHAPHPHHRQVALAGRHGLLHALARTADFKRQRIARRIVTLSPSRTNSIPIQGVRQGLDIGGATGAHHTHS